MPDWAIVLLAAFFGGLAGSVAEPVINFVLQRLRAREDIQNRRQQTFRRMVQDKMTWANHAQLMAQTLHILNQGGNAPTPERKAQMFSSGLQMYKSIPEIPPWEPERIDDPDMQKLALQYHRTMAELDGVLFAEPFDYAKATTLGAQLDELRSAMTRRMDELNWPEVEG